ncbi:sensor domain-containing diguanylate cyclase [Paenibacillus sp. YYML68]|uniref:sensor domain-containing diguanylate cyclase n=1 Tax=Paenibacillus sp. YYML68 TaxID=2909250 RepID=UPI002491CB4A|nr:sensor domain-containing diguanylate cyclase [Paenibacillus sp. YYML68]
MKLRLITAFAIMSSGFYFFYFVRKSYSGRSLSQHLIALIPLVGIVPLLVPIPMLELHHPGTAYQRERPFSPLYGYLIVVIIAYTLSWFLFHITRAYRQAKKRQFSRQELQRLKLIMIGSILVGPWVLLSELLIKPMFVNNPLFPYSVFTSYCVVMFAFFLRVAMVNYDFLSTASKRYELLFSSSTDAIFLLNDRLELVEMNSSAKQLLALTGDHAWKGKPVFHYVTIHDQEIVQRIMSALSSTEPLHMQAQLDNHKGETYDIEFSSAYIDVEGRTWTYFTVKDLSGQKEYERKLYELAYQDSLTGLVNRRRLYEVLGDQLQAHEKEQTAGFAVLLIDLDQFKWVNDTYGHSTGDELLQRVADRLRDTAPEHCTLARMGGDEFLLLLPHDGHEQAAEQLAARLVSALNKPMSLKQTKAQISASIGICNVRQGDSLELEDLIRYADIAMYEAKANGKNGYCLFDGQPIRE